MAKKAASRLVDHEVFRFILSAGAGFVVDICCYYLFYHNLFRSNSYHIGSFSVSNTNLSLSVSFFLGVTVNFLITRYFVFTASELAPAKQFSRFASVAFVGFFANMGVLNVLVKYWHWYPPVARICAALSLFFASFFIHKFFSFSLSLRHHATANRQRSN